MTLILESKNYRFEYRSESGSFNLFPFEIDYPVFKNCRLGIVYTRNKKQYTWSMTSQVENEVEYKRVNAHIGSMDQFSTGVGPDEQGVYAQLIFELLDDAPFFLWKIKLENRGDLPIFIERFDLLRLGKNGLSGELEIPDDKKESLAFFSNGWQSWSLAATYGATEKQRHSRLGVLTRPMDKASDLEQSGRAGHFVSDFFGVLGDRRSRWGVVAGFLSQREQFGVIEAAFDRSIRLNMWASGDNARLDPGASMQTDWAVLSHIDLSQPDPLGAYLELTARENGARSTGKVYSGWCSWYEYHQNITEKVIRDNLDALQAQKDRLPLDVIQIDDGYQRQVGDWLVTKDDFSDGMGSLSSEIKENGYQPGLWLAPFIVHPSAEINSAHPDWILNNERGKAVNAGFGWNTLTRALDISHPDALVCACEAVKNAVQNWQYPYLKLDFLYAAALQGKRYDPTQTRAQILRRGMEALRKAAGESVFLVGCGLPLGAGIGLVDAMRISSDVSNTWDPTYFGIKTFFRSEPFMPSARNAIQNVLTRMPMHRRWWVNDPDCLILRQPSGLNDDEVRSLATVIALSGGSMILSDDMAAVGLERMRIAENLLPVIGERGRVIDWFDQGMPEKIRLDLNGAAGKWSLLARFNWSNKKEKISITAQDFEMTSGDYRVRSFWSGLSQQVSSGEDLWNEIVPPHGCVLLAVRKSLPQQTCYLGSDLHISQGKEVIDWQETPGFLSIKINAKINGLVDLVLPRKPQKIDVAGGGELVWYEIANSCYRLQLDSAISDRSINIRF